MKKLIVIADWASEALSCQEIRTTVQGYVKSDGVPEISFIPSTRSTIHTGYLLQQVVVTENRFGKPLNTVIFQSTDPRIHPEMSPSSSHGAELLIIRLKSGMHLIGPNADFNFSLIREHIDVVFSYPGIDKDSPSLFRSRDVYARVCAHLLDSLQDDLALEEIHQTAIPFLEGHYVGHIDQNGTLYTTIRVSDIASRFSLEDHVPLVMGSISKKVRYLSSLFSGKLDELVLYPGSHGDPTDPFLELSCWLDPRKQDQETAASYFQNPNPGTRIEIMP